MRFTPLFLSLLPLCSSTPAPSPSNQAPRTFTNVTVFVPPSNYTDPRVLYARTAQLRSGDLLMTWENYSPEPPSVYFPIYRSSDNGYTWKQISQVHDQVNGWGLRYQPFLYVLPQRIGNFLAGTVLLAGNSIPTDLSETQIDLYASRDDGHAWSFVSHIAAGGEALPNNGLTPVWEPFLMVYNDHLICYYSDQRANTTNGQKLVHQVSFDLQAWGPVVDDVAYPTYTDRPGMTTVAKLPNGKYIMTYEYGGAPGFASYSFPVYYRIATNPEDFNDAEGLPIIATDGTQPFSSPYVVWTTAGGKNGTIIVSCGTMSGVFVNTQLGAQDAWHYIETPEGVSYTRSLRILQSDASKLLIAGAGHLPPSTTNKVTVTLMDIVQAMH